MTRASRLAPSAAIALLLSCTGEEAAPPAGAPSFELRPVIATAVARLEGELDAPPPPPADAEHVRGLTTMAAGGDAGLRELALEEAAGLGDAAVGELARLAADGEVPDDERAAALEALGAIGTPRAAATLADLGRTAEPGWVRAHAAWRLSEVGQDLVLPGLVLRLKYETDHDAVIWIARALGSLGNLAGLGVLELVRTASPDEELRASAAARMDEIARDAGFADAATGWTAWTEGADEPAFRPERSPRFELAVWRLVAGFTDFQLRGVDDARYTLERLGPRAAELLAEALHDESLYVRLHAAQSLQRMGPRAAPATDGLIAALDEPGVAPNAAEALGAIRAARAEAELARRLGPQTRPDLRLAAARALGGYGEEAAPATAQALRELLAGAEADELRQAAAESLVRLGHGREAAPHLASFLTSKRVEPTTSERVARAWLAGLADEGDARARACLEAWDAEALATDEIVPDARRHASRAARRELLERYLAGG